MTGTVGVLNVGAGDTKLVFDKNNPIETARASRIVKDMIRRGYVLFVQVGDAVQRALDFDANTAEYIIADLDPLKAQEVDNADEAAAEAAGALRTGLDDGVPLAARKDDTEAAGVAGKGARRGRVLGKGTRRVPASSAKATAVPRTAGG